MSALTLPQLVDRRGIVKEMGVSETAAEAVMRACEKIHLPGYRKAFVRRADVLRVLAEGTRRA